MSQFEGWSTGTVRMEIEGGYLPVTAAVECVRIAHLVHVIARADAEDPAFRSGFPLVMTTVEKYPVISVARDPLAELGSSVARAFFAQVAEHVKKQIAERPPTAKPD